MKGGRKMIVDKSGPFQFLRLRQKGHIYHVISYQSRWLYHGECFRETEWWFNAHCKERLELPSESDLRLRWYRLFRDPLLHCGDWETGNQAYDLPIEEIEKDLMRYHKDTGLPIELVGVV
jgi:hypothetical protein